MGEKIASVQPDRSFGDIGTSRFYQFGREDIRVPGDPDTPQEFTRADVYLERITAHAIETGTLWDMNSATIMAELDYLNAWHKQEVDLERRGGDRTSEYREITLRHLKALSYRRMRAFEEAGWEVTFDYRCINFLDHVISSAVAEQEELAKQLAQKQRSAEPFSTAPNQSDDLPF